MEHIDPIGHMGDPFALPLIKDLSLNFQVICILYTKGVGKVGLLIHYFYLYSRYPNDSVQLLKLVKIINFIDKTL